MCSRYALHRYQPWLPGLFQVNPVEFDDNFNVTPTTYVPVVIAEQGRRQARLMHWGLIPEWVQSLEAAKVKPVNARSETAPDKPYFRSPFRRRRCLIPLSGFFEWTDETELGKPVKQPWYIRHIEDRPLVAAGLWDVWEGDGKRIESCSILTTEPNAFMAQHHDRMPCFLELETFDAWLDPALKNPDVVLSMLNPMPGDMLQSYRVTRRMSKVTYLESDSILPIIEEQGGLF